MALSNQALNSFHARFVESAVAEPPNTVSNFIQCATTGLQRNFWQSGFPLENLQPILSASRIPFRIFLSLGFRSKAIRESGWAEKIYGTMS